MMEGRCCECFWLAEDDDGFKYCNCPYEASFTHHPDPLWGLVCSCFKPKDGCENCAHSAGYAVTGHLLCLGPAPVIFCEDVKQKCEFWEGRRRKRKERKDEKFIEPKCENCSFSYIDMAYDGTDVMYCCASEDEFIYVYDTHSCPRFESKEKNYGEDGN